MVEWDLKWRHYCELLRAIELCKKEYTTTCCVFIRLHFLLSNILMFRSLFKRLGALQVLKKYLFAQELIKISQNQFFARMIKVLLISSNICIHDVSYHVEMYLTTSRFVPVIN